MRANALRLCLAALASMALLLSPAANALLFRAYLSSAGSDFNPCTLPQPCRLLPAALTAVTSGGEIWMLDSANYNTEMVIIDKSVSIQAVPGAVGSVVAMGNPAMYVYDGGLKITLRNLVVVPVPASGATVGIVMTGDSSLTIESTLVAGLPEDAVAIAGTGKVKIANSTIRNNGGFAVSLANGAQAEISGTQMLGNAEGGVEAIAYGSTTTVAIVSDSIISAVGVGGGDYGVHAWSSGSSAAARIFVTRSTIEGFSYGLRCGTVNNGATVISISNSMITHNSYSWYQNGTGSVIESAGNNHIRGNTTSFGTLTNVGLQ